MQALNTYYTYSYNPATAENYEDILQKMTIADVQQFVKSLTSKADVVDIIFKAKAN
jgi:predicted Zn-dependent peptidase